MGLFDSSSVEDYKINLANQFVKAGDVISGNVTFTVKKSEMAFRSVSLKLVSKEWAKISYTTGSGNSRRNHTLREHRNIFKVHLTLLGAVKKQGDWSEKLAPGQYNFPFAVRIPIDAMPTYASGEVGSCGGIRWYAHSRFDIPFGSDQKIFADFYVVTGIPMGQLLAAQPYFSNRESMQRVFCCCCDDGHTQIMFSLERSLFAFCHDQQLRGSVTINNETSKATTAAVEVVLSRTLSFSAQGRSREVSAVVAKHVIPTNLPPNAAGDKTFQFVLDLPTTDAGNVSAYKGGNTMLFYRLALTCNGDTLGTVNLIAGGAADPTNQALPVGVENVQGQTVPAGKYPKFLYAPPPGSQATIPPQQEAFVGPFSLTNNVPTFPYAVASQHDAIL